MAAPPSQGKSDSITTPLLLVAVFFFAVTGGSYLFWRQSRSDPAKAPQGASENQPQAESLAAKALPLPGKASGQSGPGSEDKSQKLQRERLLESVGSISSIYLYQSYINIGLLADAAKNETYAKEQSTAVLSTIVSLVQTVDSQMQKLENVGLDAEEVDAVKQVRKISDLLISQANHLQTH